MIQRKELLILFAVIIIAKIVAACFIPVVGDETYYWYWGQNLQLSYFDHPPFVSWLAFISQAFSFFPDWLQVRAPFIFLSTCSVFVWLGCYRLTFKSDHKSNLYFILFFLLNPLLGVGGIFATPDVPLVFFWGCSFYFALRALQFQSSWDYILLGLSLGLGFCAKYHIVLFVPSFLLYLYFKRQFYKIKLPKILMTFLLGLTFSSPVIIWNYLNEWESFLFQLNHGFSRPNYNWQWSATYLLGQILLFSPILITALVKQWKSHKNGALPLFQWGFFLFSSFKAPVEANWPITAHAHGLAATDYQQANIRAHLTYWALVYILLVAFLASPFGKEKISSIPNSIEIKKISDDLLNYQPLFGPSYQISSLLHYLTGAEVKKLPLLGRFDFYDRLQKFPPEMKSFYVLKHSNSVWPSWTERYKKSEIKKYMVYNLELFQLSYE